MKLLLTIDRLNAWVGKSFAWCILIMTFGVSYEVLVRYVFRAPTTWAFDVSYIMYGTLFMMAGAYTLSKAGHVRGDVLYGFFDWLKSIQTDTFDPDTEKTDNPKVKLRMLNHWDNLDRTVERGYAGFSLWDWHKLPDYLDPRYTDYARANASIGINCVVLNNVNANALILTPSVAGSRHLGLRLRRAGIDVAIVRNQT